MIIKRFKYKFLVFLFCLFSIASVSNAQSTIQGQVIGVSDGDTITVLQGNKQYKIRLYGIDCPEKKQAFGQKAKQFTSDQVFRQSVRVVSYDTDRYGRVVGVVYKGNYNLNEGLLSNGFAWVYTTYCKESFCDKWKVLENKAKTTKIGLWIDKDPIEPWDFRKGKRTDNKVTIKAMPGLYHGNTNSHVFHQSSCKYFNCKNCTKIFNSRESAIKDGFRPCGLCKP